jgi:hypothetical protein
MKKNDKKKISPPPPPLHFSIQIQMASQEKHRNKEIFIRTDKLVQ